MTKIQKEHSTRLKQLKVETKKKIKYLQKKIDGYVDVFVDEMALGLPTLTITQEYIASVYKELMEKLRYYKMRLYALTSNDFEIVSHLQHEIAYNFPMNKLVKSRLNKAICPFHDDHSPSMKITGSLWYCFVCGIGGNSISYIQRLYDVDRQDAIKILNKY